MAFKTSDGKNKNSKFRQSRYDRENASSKESPQPKPKGELESEEENAGRPDKKGARAQMHSMEDHPQGNPEQRPGGMPGEEQMEEEVSPGIHDAVKQMAAEHGPAHEVHVAHDHAAGMHTVSHKHPDGFNHTQTHNSPMHAHHHAMHAAGVDPKGEGNYPAENESPMQGGGDGEQEFPL